MKEKCKYQIAKAMSFLSRRWIWICYFFGISTYLLYVFYMYEEVPFETYIDKLYLVEEFYSGDLKFSSLLSTYAEHGMLAANLFFLVNLKLFRYSVLAESLVNAVLVAIVGGVVLEKYSSYIKEKKGIFYYISIIIMTILLFTCLQQGGGGMSLQVRFGLTAMVVTTCMIDNIILQKRTGIVYYILTIIAIFLSINLFGTMYSFAGVPMIGLLIIFLCVKQKKIDLKKLGIGLAYVFAVVLYFVQYGFVSFTTQGTAGSGGLMGKVMSAFTNVNDLLLSFLYWCGNIILGRAALEDGYLSSNLYLIVGMVVVLILVHSFYLYFRSRMYQKTYLPIMWIGYVMLLFLVLYVGRGNQGAEWFTSSWYAVHTKIASASILGIYLYSLKDIRKIPRNIIIWFNSIIIGLVVLFGTCCYMARMPHEKTWIKDKQAYFYVESKEELPVDANGTTPLFKDVETSWQAICILKEYNLSIFRNYDAYELMQERRKALQETK